MNLPYCEISIFLFTGINVFQFNRNDGTLVQSIEGATQMNRRLEDGLEQISEDGESVVVLTNS